MSDNRARTVFILGLNSDIGRELGKRYLADGYRVCGTYRRQAALEELPAGATLFRCDVTSSASVRSVVESCRAANLRWDIFIGAVGTEEPIGPFFDCDFDAWAQSVKVNALGLLRVLHALYPLRAPGRECASVLFAGAGTNNAAPNYSAYCVSKILLIKMCELLAAETPDLNLVIIGPGMVRTKIHEQTLRAGERSGANYDKVVRFLGSDDPGVFHDDIYACVNWCIRAGREVVGGRNLSLVHDTWRRGGEALKRALLADENMYKLRRCGNARLING